MRTLLVEIRGWRNGVGVLMPQALPAGLLVGVATAPTMRPSPTASALPESAPCRISPSHYSSPLFRLSIHKCPAGALLPNHAESVNHVSVCAYKKYSVIYALALRIPGKAKGFISNKYVRLTKEE